MIVYINDADLEMLDTCICKSLLSRVVVLNVLSTELDESGRKKRNKLDCRWSTKLTILATIDI